MNKDIHVTLAGNSEEYLNFLNFDFFVTTDKIWPDTNLLFLTGGTDISPSIYQEEISDYTQLPDARRDAEEVRLVKKAVKNNIPIIGICRGAQLLTALAGGILIQHVDNHSVFGTHSMNTNDGNEFEVSSDHHQMMYPFGYINKEDYEIIGWSKYNRSDVYFKGKKNIIKELPKDFVEPEIVYYKKLNALAIQPHPEWQLHDDNHKPFILWLNNLIKTKLLGTLLNEKVNEI